MTTTTPKLVTESRAQARARGFTLVEVLIASGLGAGVLAAVLSAFIFITRASLSISDYAEMETQARETLERFAQDVRKASSVTWITTQSVTLGVVERDESTTLVTYTYHATASNQAPAGSFTRRQGTGRTDVLLTGIRVFNFSAYNITTASVALGDLAAASAETKQIQISLETQRQRNSLALSTNKVISARFVLRNKRVTA